LREGFQKKSSALIQKQTPEYSVVRHNCKKGLDFCGQMKLVETEKNSFLAANAPDVFGASRDKSTPCLRLNILLDL